MFDPGPGDPDLAKFFLTKSNIGFAEPDFSFAGQRFLSGEPGNDLIGRHVLGNGFFGKFQNGVNFGPVAVPFCKGHNLGKVCLCAPPGQPRPGQQVTGNLILDL